MGTIPVDAATAELLRNAAAGTQVVGPDGRLLALVLPEELLPAFRRLIEDLPPRDVTLKELKAADAAGGEFPMEDLLKLLEKYK